MANNRKFKKLLIYPSFQLPLITLNIAIVVGAFIVLYLLSSNTHSNIVQLGLDSKISITHPYFKFTSYQFEQYRNALIWGMAFTMFFSSFALLYFTHKIAGPLVRLNNELKKVAQTGKIETLKFRKGDYFGDIEKNYNQMVEGVNNREDKNENVA